MYKERGRLIYGLATMELAGFEKDLNLAESLFSSNLIHVLSLCCLRKYWMKFWTMLFCVK